MSCSSLELPASEAMLLAKERQAQQSGSGSTLLQPGMQYVVRVSWH